MFTGIIQAKSKVIKAERKRGSLFLTIQKPKAFKIRAGDSIATNGVCLTVKKIIGPNYLTELMPETLIKTSFGKSVPAKVNLEQPLKFSSLLGGHLVLGHVDAIGRIQKSEIRNPKSEILTISYPKKFNKLVVEKGSVTVDGVSLTAFNVRPGSFDVSLVDYTLEHTTLGEKKTGDLANIEFDIIGKYIIGR